MRLHIEPAPVEANGALVFCGPAAGPTATADRGKSQRTAESGDLAFRRRCARPAPSRTPAGVPAEAMGVRTHAPRPHARDHGCVGGPGTYGRGGWRVFRIPAGAGTVHVRRLVP